MARNSHGVAHAGSDGCSAGCAILGFSIDINNGRGVVSRTIGEGGGQERELAEKYRSWARQRSMHYPYVGSILVDIAADYDRQALRQDEKAKTDLRLEHWAEIRERNADTGHKCVSVMGTH